MVQRLEQMIWRCRSRRSILHLLLIGLIGLSGCVSGKVAPLEPANSAIAQSAQPRELAPAVDNTTLTTLGADTSAFALSLYQALRGENGNLFFSPYSVTSALAMVYAGARGETAQQMAGAMRYTLPQEQLHPAFNALNLQLTTPQDSDGLTLTVASSLWGQRDHDFLPEYLDLLATNYGAGIRLVDFTSDPAREQARAAINDWVRQETRDKIRELIGEGQLTDATKLVLANAIYFDATWQTPFDRGTQDAPFTLLDGSITSVPLMASRSILPYARGAGYQAVAIPYTGDRARMVVLLPDSGTFESAEQALTPAYLDSVLQSLQPVELNIFMPRFSFETSQLLNEPLSALGMPLAFAERQADLSGIDGTQNLFISQVIHKAFVKVDERGTEAAAATGVVVEAVSARPDQPERMVIDRPFIFMIQDTATGAVLFMGRVLDPSQK